MRMRLFLFAGLLLAGCSVFDPGSDDLAEIRAARQAWARQGLHAYSFTYDIGCFCGTRVPTRVVVRADTVNALFDARTGEVLTPEQMGWLGGEASFRRLYPTVDELFDRLEEAARKGNRVEFRFDPARSFPAEAFIDYIARAIDDEVTYRISELRPE